MDKVSRLHEDTTALQNNVEVYLGGNDQQEFLLAKLDRMELLLFSAMDQLEEMGGFGAFDEEVSKTIKSGLERVSFVIMQKWAIDPGNKKGCNFNSMLMCVFGVSCDKDKNRLKKFAKEALKALPLFTDPERQGRSFVKQMDMTKFERLMNEKEVVVRNLLSSKLSYNKLTRVSVVPILGMTGAGKTSLARLVLIDPRVRQQFDVSLWVNISGLSTGLDIVHEAARSINLYTEQSQSSEFLRTELEDKKFLLVLENLFEEYDGSWFKLLKPLLSVAPNCKHGSRLLVTTRSTSLRRNALSRLPMASGVPYLLKPPPMKESLALFQSIAFRDIVEEDRDLDLIDIAVKICNKCNNNLHAITIIASILSFQPTHPKRWLYVNDILLESIEDPIESMQSIVDLMQIRYKWGPKFLTYTCLFPFDYKFSKADLRPLWELQGSIGVDSSEEFNEYVDNLLDVGYFFEDSKTDKTGDIVIYYKINALLHEVVKHLARDEWRLLDMFATTDSEVDADMIQNVSFMIESSSKVPSWLHGAKQLQSLFFFPTKSSKFINIPNFSEIVLNLKALKALDLVMVHFDSCPDFLGELKLLRYLRLGISLDYFPECITNLNNLHTLDLRHTAIKELPTNFYKLPLKFLYTGCRMVDLPPRFGEISYLQILDEFIVGENNGLDELAKLTYLAGRLNIRYQIGREKHTMQVNEQCLAGRNLRYLSLTWCSSNDNGAKDIHEEREALECEFLQPPSTLESLAINGWKGVKFPQWATDHFSISLKSLMSVQIVDCSRCIHLPSFSLLPSLTSLILRGLPVLEWIENPNADSKASSSGIKIFPALKYLTLTNLPQLKGWSKDETDLQQNLQSLIELKVGGCPKMVSMPLAPSLAKLEVVDIHGKLLKHLLDAQETPASSSTSSTLKELHIKSVQELESFTITISSLQVLTIRECKDLATVFVDPSNTLKQLQIQACVGVKHISQVLHNLTVLEDLEIDGCEESGSVDKMEVSARAAWQRLKSLRSLTLTNISKPEPFLEGLGYLQTLTELSLCWLYDLTVLPESLKHLTRLTQLVIRNCPKVKRIPEYFPRLGSLNLLQIKECSKLERRCRLPQGEDCHLIQHILPGVYLGELPIQQED